LVDLRLGTLAVVERRPWPILEAQRPKSTHQQCMLGAEPSAITRRCDGRGARAQVWRLRANPPKARVPYSLPDRARVGVCTVHRYRDERLASPDVTISAFVPMQTDAFVGSLLNLEAIRFDERIPDRAIIADGGRTRAFIGIDQRPGTPLDAYLERIVACVPRGKDGVDPEAALEYLRVNAARILKMTKGAATNDPSAELPWDRQIQLSEGDMTTFAKASALEFGAVPVMTPSDRPVVPLERYIERGEGYCIQRAILVDLVLRRLGIPSRVVTGAISVAPGVSSGHTWVELGDGRVFDPSWRLIAKPGARDENPPHGFKFGDSYRYAYRWFVYLRD
jgi:transglutaminase superfamily protein